LIEGIFPVLNCPKSCAAKTTLFSNWTKEKKYVYPEKKLKFKITKDIIIAEENLIPKKAFSDI
jgi:hypothetical protein